MQQITADFAAAVGDTPLIRMNRLSEETGCEILGKAEFMNPGGSVKDRAALWIIREHEKSGALRPGGTVVEGTAGNTGIGLAHICNMRGYPCVIYMPDNQSQEKVDILRTLGAEVRVVPTVPYRDEMNYQKQAGRFAATLPNGVWANQFDNTANRLAHYESTGPEIWRQTGGKVDAFVSAVGTGGTLSGVARFLKERRTTIRTVLADCMGSALYSFVKTGEAVMSEGPSITEGIGNSRVTDNFDGAPVDDAVQVTDQQMVTLIYRLLREEGWFFGSSTGINLHAAAQVAREMGPGPRHRHHALRRWREVPVAALRPRLAGRAGLVAVGATGGRTQCGLDGLFAQSQRFCWRRVSPVPGSSQRRPTSGWWNSKERSGRRPPTTSFAPWIAPTKRTSICWCCSWTPPVVSTSRCETW